MQLIASDIDQVQDLRREINALHGLLHFSKERSYPEGITRSLRLMLAQFERVLQDHEKAELSV